MSENMLDYLSFNEEIEKGLKLFFLLNGFELPDKIIRLTSNVGCYFKEWIQVEHPDAYNTIYKRKKPLIGDDGILFDMVYPNEIKPYLDDFMSNCYLPKYAKKFFKKRFKGDQLNDVYAALDRAFPEEAKK